MHCCKAKIVSEARRFFYNQAPKTFFEQKLQYNMKSVKKEVYQSTPTFFLHLFLSLVERTGMQCQGIYLCKVPKFAYEPMLPLSTPWTTPQAQNCSITHNTYHSYTKGQCHFQHNQNALFGAVNYLLYQYQVISMHPSWNQCLVMPLFHDLFT